MLQRNRKRKILSKKRKENAIKDRLLEERVMWRKKREYYAKTLLLINHYSLYAVAVRRLLNDSITFVSSFGRKDIPNCTFSTVKSRVTLDTSFVCEKSDFNS